MTDLRRISRCCGERVAHPRKFPDLGLICVGCWEPVREFLLENCLGEIVWPPPDEDVARIPMPKRAKRVRRKPAEAEPEPYRVFLPWERG